MSKNYKTTPEELERRTARLEAARNAMTSEQKSEIAKKAAATREAKRKELRKRLQEAEKRLRDMQSTISA